MATSEELRSDFSEPEHAALLRKGMSDLGKSSSHSHTHNALHHALMKPAHSASSASSSASTAPSSSASPSSGPRPVSTAFKMLLFFSIVTWSTSAALIVRYSQGVLKEKYSIVGSVVVTEVIKLMLSTLAVCRDYRWSVVNTMKRCFTIMGSSLPMAVPAVVYLVQNTLNYVALQSIPSATHAILVQLKLLTTAIFAVLILRKQIFFYQWRALFLLFIGIVLVQWPTSSSTPAAGAVADTTVQAPAGQTATGLDSTGGIAGGGGVADGASFGAMLSTLPDLIAKYGGVMAATTQAALSGFSGVYTEWRLKGRGSFTLWENNFQLCFYSICFGVMSLMLSTKDLDMITTQGFFHGYSIYTWSCIALNSWGGLMVAAILLYCDNILKNFASSVSILATSVLGFMMYGEPQFTVNFFCGACVLISAIFIYNEDIIALAGQMQQTRKEAEDATKLPPLTNGAYHQHLNATQHSPSSADTDQDDDDEDDSEEGEEAKEVASDKAAAAVAAREKAQRKKERRAKKKAGKEKVTDTEGEDEGQSRISIVIAGKGGAGGEGGRERGASGGGAASSTTGSGKSSPFHSSQPPIIPPPPQWTPDLGSS